MIGVRDNYRRKNPIPQERKGEVSDIVKGIAIEVLKTTSEARTVRQLAYGMFSVEAIIRIRKERHCWFCDRKFTESTDGKLSLAFTNKGNELVCTQCADDMIARGVEHADRRKKETT
jgi:hypothetical protein